MCRQVSCFVRTLEVLRLGSVLNRHARSSLPAVWTKASVPKEVERVSQTALWLSDVLDEPLKHAFSETHLHSPLHVRRLMEIESRLLPCGLHVVGSPPTAAEAVATLVNIAEIDRPENQPPTRGLPGVLARAVGRDIEQIYISSNKASTFGCFCPTRA